MSDYAIQFICKYDNWDKISVGYRGVRLCRFDCSSSSKKYYLGIYDN